MSALITPWSIPATTRRVIELLDDVDWETGRVADVGAGEGYFSERLSQLLQARGGEPAEHVFACDLFPESFQCESVTCSPIAPDGRFPFSDGAFDAAVSIEVIEHVEDQFAFMREMARITKPGGLVLVTTPNILNANSRLRTLMTGFPELFDPLPLGGHDPRHLGGHLHPVSPYFLAYAALRAGLVEPTFHPDRTKKSAAFLTILLSPLFLLGHVFLRARTQRKTPAALEQNRALIGQLGGWGLLTSRTTVLRARKPEA